MANAAKILRKMRNNPRDWRMDDLRALANHYEIEHDQPGTSHVTFRHVKAGRLTVPADRPVQPVYVRRFVDSVKEEKK